MDGGARTMWERSRPTPIPVVPAACIAPWVSLEFDPSGIVYACCASQLYPVGRIPDMSLTDIWSGPRIEALRRSLVEWDLSVACGSCRWHLETGRLDPDAAVYDKYRLDSPDPSGPVAMTFALSNRCNLACVMCSPELSSTLRRQAGMARLESPYGDEFFRQIRPLLPSLQYAKFLGGEPLLIEEHHRIWDLMIDVGGPPRIQITTNGTIWNERVVWLLEHFAVDVTVSIDAIDDDTYRAIRGGVDPDAVRRNVGRFLEHCRARGTELRFCFCLMRSNWAELGPFLRWASTLEVPVSVNVVSDPGVALYDSSAEELAEVVATWSVQADELEGSLGLNLEVWRTQLRQVRNVVEGRAAGRTEPPRHARREARAALGAVPAMAPPPDDAHLLHHRRRLAQWSSSGAVAELQVDHGRVRRVDVGAPRLGIDATLEGLEVGAVIDRIAESSGQEAWLVAHEDLEDGAVRSFAISHEAPARGTAGTVVRTVTVPSAEGALVLLVAVDDFYAPTPVSGATPVDAPGRRS